MPVKYNKCPQIVIDEFNRIGTCYNLKNYLGCKSYVTAIIEIKCRFMNIIIEVIQKCTCLSTIALTKYILSILKSCKIQVYWRYMYMCLHHLINFRILKSSVVIEVHVINVHPSTRYCKNIVCKKIIYM